MKGSLSKAKNKIKAYNNPWILDLLHDPTLANKFQSNREFWPTKQDHSGLCVACKGSRMMCGKTRCPVMVRVNSILRVAPMINGLDIDGSSPPSVFVGRMGYPYVYIGPLVPPIHDDTSLFDLPELWFGKTIDEIVRFRSMLVRGKHRVHVQHFDEAGKIMDKTRDLALASKATDVELRLKKKPRGFLVFNEDVQPFGPSAQIRNLHVESTRWENHIEKAYYDTDLKARSAVLGLYKSNVLITKIQRAFSVGAFGVESKRRLVPTRWSITAVDSLISKEMINQIKTLPLINEYRLYESSYLENQFEVLMIPDVWSYEAIEAWYPGTVWNPSGKRIVVYGDYEKYDGRTTYAAIGGCYYAARLAVCELLRRERRQATVVVLREARPGYIMPVGVWQVRENVRNAVQHKPLKFNSLQDALERVGTQFKIPLRLWIERSKLLTLARTQSKITNFLQPSLVH